MKELKIGEMIKELRGVKGVSQETLAAVCDVSMQAVSKWENGQSCPDIAFLPLLAEYFQVSIDYLLTGKESEQKCAAEDTDMSELTEQIKQMTKQDTLYIIQYRNGQILDKKTWEREKWDREEAEHKNAAIRIVFEEEFERLKKGLRVEVWGNAEIGDGNICMDLTAGGNVACVNVEGDLTAGGNVKCINIEGNVNAGGTVECDNVEGEVNAGGTVTCDTVEGDVSAGGTVKCGSVEGDVTAGGNVECGNVEGDVSAGNDLTCNDIDGDAEARNNISCGTINGDARADKIEYKK